MGNIVSAEKMITLGSKPKVETVAGLEHIRIFTGHYRTPEDLENLNDEQKKDNASKGVTGGDDFNALAGKDPVQSLDPIELQVFSTVAGGESTPMSARTTWSKDSVLAPASGVYVLDLAKVREEIATQEVPSEDAATEDIGDVVPETVVEEDNPVYKFPNNPLAGPLYVTDNFGRERGATTHTGLDLRARTRKDVFAVDSGTITQTGSQIAPGYPISGTADRYGSGGNIVSLVTEKGFRVLYVHLDDSTRDLGLTFGQKVTAGQKIGVTGRTGGGSRTGVQPHLHMTVFALQEAVDADPPIVPAGTNPKQKIDPRPMLPGPADQRPPLKKEPKTGNS